MTTGLKIISDMTQNCIYCWNSGEYGVPLHYSFPLLQGPLWPAVVVPVRVQSIGQTDLLFILDTNYVQADDYRQNKIITTEHLQENQLSVLNNP